MKILLKAIYTTERMYSLLTEYVWGVHTMELKQAIKLLML